MLLLDFRQIKPVVTRLEQLQQKLAQKWWQMALNYA